MVYHCSLSPLPSICPLLPLSFFFTSFPLPSISPSHLSPSLSLFFLLCFFPPLSPLPLPSLSLSNGFISFNQTCHDPNSMKGDVFTCISPTTLQYSTSASIAPKIGDVTMITTPCPLMVDCTIPLVIVNAFCKRTSSRNCFNNRDSIGEASEDLPVVPYTSNNICTVHVQ